MKTLNANIPNILLVDESLNSLALLKVMLEPVELNFYIATSVTEGLKRIDENNFDIVLLDTGLSDRDPYEICRKIKNDVKKYDTPVLLLSSFSSYDDKMKCFESGADDYLTKPLSSNELIARVQLHLQKQTVLKHMKQLLKHSYHELYNPLAVINSSVEMFELYHEPNKYINSIHAAAKSLHVIYDDLYYSLSPGATEEQKKSVNLENFISNRVDFFKLLAEVKGVEIVLNLDSSLEINISEVDLLRIVDNTLSNAIKYSFENAQITVSLVLRDTIELCVSNKGKDIKLPEYIFKEGYREDYDKTGMGIGLEIVSSICNKYKIKVIVVSQDNNTSFTYIFPRSKNENNSDG